MTSILDSTFWPVMAGFSPLVYLVVIVVPVLILAIIVTVILDRMAAKDTGWRPGEAAPRSGFRAALPVIIIVLIGVTVIALLVWGTSNIGKE